MKINFSYRHHFNQLIENLKEKYGQEMFEIEGIGSQLDIDKYNRAFFDSEYIQDASVDANANVRSKHIGTYFTEVFKPVTRLNSIYLIWKEMAKEFGLDRADEFVEAQITGAIYTHDLHFTNLPYCYSYTLEPIVKNGLTFIDTITSAPAKHTSTFIQHVVQFVTAASNLSAGAVGIPDLFVWLYYYIKKDLKEGFIPSYRLNWFIEQNFQILTYSLNQPNRGTQSSYTNFTYMDRNYIQALFEDKTYPDGTPIVDELDHIIELQKHYWEWITKEREKQMFTFPVMTAALLYQNGEFVDEDSARFINKVNMKWQDTNWYISESVDSLSSCCRLVNNFKDIGFGLSSESTENEKLNGWTNSVGGSDLNIGSFKVVTINLPRIALEAKDDLDKFVSILNKRLDLTTDVLYVVREILKERIAQNVLPFYKQGLMDLNRQYGTVGFTGVWEAASLLGLTEQTVTGNNYTPEGEYFVDLILEEIKKALDRGFKKYQFTYNTEQVPAEKAAVTLAEKDILLFGEDKQPFTLYSNQWIPLIADTDILTRVRASANWDKKVSGGAILHINIDNQFEDEERSWNLVKMIANSGVIYFAFNSRISVCENKHAFIGNKCPICGKPKVDEYVRIVGYLVPVSAFNKTRKEVEYPSRKFYKMTNDDISPKEKLDLTLSYQE